MNHIKLPNSQIIYLPKHPEYWGISNFSNVYFCNIIPTVQIKGTRDDEINLANFFGKFTNDLMENKFSCPSFSDSLTISASRTNSLSLNISNSKSVETISQTTTLSNKPTPTLTNEDPTPLPPTAVPVAAEEDNHLGVIIGSTIGFISLVTIIVAAVCIGKKIIIASHQNGLSDSYTNSHSQVLLGEDSGQELNDLAGGQV